ncbi:hypothetical protein C1H46_012713 [Malus baccata]|uniref:Uncharacterized protein n=1 Tax=Malus baccata TaxID=106549 RepID=A0A540MS77_MALBA|nr:hypothetical protein C1H46_012713 [Malus baccata]
MNAVELLSDLYALRQLYGLLQNGEGWPQHVNSNNALDTRARQLLKDLLDDAAEKIFNTHLKMITTQAAVSSKPCPSQPEQPKAVPKKNSPLSPTVTVKSSPNRVLNDDGKDSKKYMFAPEENGSLKKLKPEREIAESKVSISSGLPEQKKKVCRICLENNLKKQYSAKETKFSNDRVKVPDENSVSQDKQHDWHSHLNVLDEHAKRLQESNTKSTVRGNDISETLGNPSIVSSGACSPISPTRMDIKQEVGLYPIGQSEEKSDEGSDYSKVVAIAIKQIESRILAVQLSYFGMANSFNNDANEHGSFKRDISFSPCTPTPTAQIEERRITTRAAVSSKPCPCQPEQPKAVPKKNSPLSPTVTVKSSPNRVLNDDGKDSKKYMFAPEENGSLKKLKPEREIAESKVSISSGLPEQKKKVCRICLENNLKKQYSAKETKFSNDRVKVPDENSVSQDKQHDWHSHLNVLDEHAKRLQESNTKSTVRGNDISETLGNPSIVSSGACSPISPTRMDIKQEVGLYPIGQSEEKSDEGSDYSKVVAIAIKQIESRILAVQLSYFGMANSFNNDANEHGSFKRDISFSPCTPTPTAQIEERVTPPPTISTTITRRELSGMDKSFPLLGGTQLLTRQASQLLSQNPTGKFASTSREHGSSKGLMERLGSLRFPPNQPVSRKEKMAGYVNGLSVPMPNQAPMHVKTPDQTWKTTPVQNATTRKIRAARSNRFMPPEFIASSVGHGPSCKKLMSQTRRISLVTNQRHHTMTVKPVLLDEHKPSGTHKMSYAGQQKKRMPRKQVLDMEEETSSGCTDSETWSTWTSETNSEAESSAGSNEYSKEDSWSRGLSRRRTRDIHMRMRSDLSSSTRSINTAAEVSASSSSRNSSCSSSMEGEEDDDLYSRKRYPDKSVGRFRRLKNRLGLIFHHHHHHHHHYDRNGNSDDDRGHTGWKHLRRKMFDSHKNPHGTRESRGSKKSLVKVKNMLHNKQGEVGHFHALLEGLLRHIRHSKKSNNYLSKGGGVGGGGRSCIIRKKKKLHWWQMFRRRRVKKQPNKAKRGRVKFGFTAKRRPKLKIK